MDIDAESSDCIHIKFRGWIVVIFQHLLHAGNTTVELIHILHRPHGFCHKGITIVIDRGEVLRSSLTI